MDPSGATVARGLVKMLGPNRAVDGLGLTVPLGAVYGLLGPNGAGKTTTIRHPAIDDDEGFRHVFVFDSQRIPRYSDSALQRMREALAEVDMDEIWAAHRPRRRAA